jgi:hypothetical protein
MDRGIEETNLMILWFVKWERGGIFGWVEKVERYVVCSLFLYILYDSSLVFLKFKN